jgi:hypothetical protein
MYVTGYGVIGDGTVSPKKRHKEENNGQVDKNYFRS